MDKDAAKRIQSNADRNNKNQDFKSRAMSAADRNSAPKSGGQGGGTSSKQGGNTNASSGGNKKK
ncbi:hypothetical protein K503DRAFT_110672 [Rhizopogon vinicolor AM-OR11-026]|uniref:SMP domain-containing protein n=1 Tax=Rhizopogon vinicolor AM-OR11-026 TaxID=1314800 RepID=A0A1B7N2Q0_9AGAM|nr:hypothetical protein K503DRAFT_110672 [Rhizopogon vinicolor AM-OR11-026]